MLHFTHSAVTALCCSFCPDKLVLASQSDTRYLLFSLSQRLFFAIRKIKFYYKKHNMQCLSTQEIDRSCLHPLHSHICKSAVHQINQLQVASFSLVMPAWGICTAAVPMARSWCISQSTNRTVRPKVLNLELIYCITHVYIIGNFLDLDCTRYVVV